MNPVTGSPRITPPATGSYQIPTVANNQTPYYDSAAPAGSPGQAAPGNPDQWRSAPAGQAPATSTAATWPAVNSGYPVAGNLSQRLTIPANNLTSNQVTSTLGAPTGQPAFDPATAQSGAASVTTANVVGASGDPRVARRSPGEAMPLNDASTVRAPVTLAQQNAWAYAGPPGWGQTASVPGLRTVQGQAEYVTRPNVAGWPTPVSNTTVAESSTMAAGSGQGYVAQGYTAQSYPSFAPGAPATTAPYNGGYQPSGGWYDRSATTGAGVLNR